MSEGQGAPDWRSAPPPQLPPVQPAPAGALPEPRPATEPLASTQPTLPAAVGHVDSAFVPSRATPGLPIRRPWRSLPMLPQQPTSYLQFFRTPRWRWWLGLIVAAGLAFGLAVLAGLPVGVALAVDLMSGRTTVAEVQAALAKKTIPVTTGIFLANNVGLALMIPWCLLLAWWCTGQRPKWLSSVVGGLRWRWLLLVAVAISPIWLVMVAIDLSSTWRELTPGPDTTVLIIGILLTQPLQAAGEEYFFRGLFARVVGGWVRPEKLALGLAWVSSSVVFMVVHAAGDVYLNIFYFTFGMVASWLTWRTGGLEAAIAIHVVNNLAGMVAVPFSDISTLFDRGAGTVSAVEILPTLATMVVAVVVVELLRRKRSPQQFGPPEVALARSATPTATPPGNPIGDTVARSTEPG